VLNDAEALVEVSDKNRSDSPVPCRITVPNASLSRPALSQRGPTAEIAKEGRHCPRGLESSCRTRFARASHPSLPIGLITIHHSIGEAQLIVQRVEQSDE